MSEYELESKLKQRIIRHAKERGWFVEVIQKCGRRGFPDLFLLKMGTVILFETKRKNKTARAQQEKRHREIFDHGGLVYVIDNFEDAARILK